jgi:O-antigen/teichoic acid export membrane protein
MKQLRTTILKNTFANLMRGGATAGVALALPHFLTQTLDHERFAGWCFLLQIAAYANYLDFGVQAAVARFLAAYTELGEEERRNALVSTALGLLSCAALIGCIALGVIIRTLPSLFPSIPTTLIPEVRAAVAILGGTAVLSLPLSTFSGVLLGLHRNEYLAASVVGTRILGAALILLVSRRTDSLLALSACLAFANLLGIALQVFFAKSLLPSLRLSRSRMQRSIALELGKYCMGLSVWSAGMLLISGLDIAIVGHFDFGAVGYYSIAATLVMLFSGAHGAASTALMTPVAALQATGEVDRIRRLILQATSISTFINLLAIAITFLAGKFVLVLWVGEPYATQALPIFKTLMIANGIRLVMSPYSCVLIATDLQRRAIAQGGVEGLVNLIFSVVGAYRIGAIGVALGTLIGAIFGLAWSCLLTVKRTTEISVGRRNFIGQGILRPFLCALPVIACATIMHDRTLTLSSAIVLIGSGVLTYFLAYQFGRVLPSPFQLGKLFPQLG